MTDYIFVAFVFIFAILCSTQAKPSLWHEDFHNSYAGGTTRRSLQHKVNQVRKTPRSYKKRSSLAHNLQIKPLQWYDMTSHLTLKPSARFDAATFTNWKNGVTFFFSGVDENWKISSVMQQFDHFAHDFKRVDQLVDIPGFRDGAMIITKDLGMLFFGGLNQKKEYNSEIIYFDQYGKHLLDSKFNRQRFTLLPLNDVYLVIGGREKTADGEILSTSAIIIPKMTVQNVKTWKVVELDQQVFPPREWLSSTPLNTTSGFIFGGTNSEALSDSFIISFDGLTVQIQPIHSIGPSPRSGHNMITLKGDIFIIGGENDQGNGMNDVWRFDTDTQIYSKVLEHSENMRGFLGASIFPVSFGTTIIPDGFCIYGGVSGWNHDTKISGKVDCIWMNMEWI